MRLLWVWWTALLVCATACTEGNPDAEGGDASPDGLVADMASTDSGGGDATAPDQGPPECQPGDREADTCPGGGERTRVCDNGRWGAWLECPPCFDGAEERRACGLNDRGDEARFCVDGTWSDWSACADPDVCADGVQEGAPCGVAGTRQRACVDGAWGPFGPCSEMPTCVDGDAQIEPCGLNGNGTRERACVDGQFGDWGACADPDECVEDAVEEMACGIEGNGRVSRSCVGGRWTAYSPCDDPDQACVDDDRVARPCGLNGRGRQDFRCEEGRYAAEGPCEDADVCVDAATENAPCGLNGAGRRTRLCEDGQWGDWGDCVDPDECVADAEEIMICGLNGRGEASRRCLDGRWSDWSICVDPDECTDDVIDALPDGCGLNGRGQQTRSCEVGAWVERCVDPDRCVDGEAEARPCGDDGMRRRRCEAGQWGPFDACDAADPCPDVENPECGPGRPERCNGLDDDHDGAVDEGLLLDDDAPVIPTDFDIQVDAAIDAGLGWLRAQIRDNGDVPDARHAGLAALTLMERRAGFGLGAPLGYEGLDAADKARVRLLLAATVRAERALSDPEALDNTYVAGAAAMAFSLYLSTGGPDAINPELQLGARQALTNVVRALVANQGDGDNNDGGWNYREPGATGDTSTTHFVVNGLAAALPIRAAGGAAIEATVPFLESIQKADGGGAYNLNQQSSSSMTSVMLWMYRLAEIPPGDVRVDAALDWLADPFLADRMAGPFAPTSIYYYFWAAAKGLGVSVDRHDPRFTQRDPVELGYPDVAPSWYFEFASTLLDWQDPDGAWGTGHNGSTRGWSQMSSHLFALLTLERSFGGVMPDGAGQGFAPQCADEVDNDGDGLVDADDPQCRFVCTPLERPVPACANAMDDDGDGRIDLDDPGCADRVDDDEQDADCSNRVDDDDDGLVDWPADPGCRDPADPSEADPAEAPACANGIDDDEDGAIDFDADAGCLWAGQGAEDAADCPIGVSFMPRGTTEVFGVVPDGPGVMDTRCGGRGGEALHLLRIPARMRIRVRVESAAFDPVLAIRRSCDPDNRDELRCNQDVSADDPSAQVEWILERGDWFLLVDSNFGSGAYRLTVEYRDAVPPPACDNGVDDDGDQRIDRLDPGCTDPLDDDEGGPANPACANGEDDDGDGQVDWPADPGCLAAGDVREDTPAPPPPCSNGRDDDADGLTDFPADPSCLDAAGQSEFGAPRR